MMKSKRLGYVGYVVRMWEINAYSGLMGKPEERRWLGRHRSRWEDNIKVGVKERECTGFF
jgi:hypothetical protein